jgi:hypothetical protein
LKGDLDFTEQGIFYEKNSKNHWNCTVGHLDYNDISGLHTLYFQGEICRDCQKYGQQNTSYGNELQGDGCFFLPSFSKSYHNPDGFLAEIFRPILKRYAYQGPRYFIWRQPAKPVRENDKNHQGLPEQRKSGDTVQ